jgi:transposase
VERVTLAAGKPLFVGQLRKRARNRLASALDASSDGKYRDRCRAVLWSADGKGVPEIAKLLRVHRITAQRWLKDYLRFGLDGLEIRKPTGRPPKVDGEVEAVISQAVHENPRDLGYPFSRWTASTMTAHVARETHVHMHPDTIRRAMKRLHLSYKRPKLSLKHRQDKAALRKAKRARDKAIKRATHEPADHVFLFQDECEIHLNPSLSSCWGPIGEPILVPSAGPNKKVPIFGSLNPSTGKVIVDLTPRKRSADFIAHLKHVLRLHRGKHVWMFLDNCSIHNSKAVRRFVADRAGRLTLIWNAPYTPELNLIERYWGHLKSTALNSYLFETIEHLEGAIRAAVRHLNKDGEAKMNVVAAAIPSLQDAA